jgi:hypothetical protein
MDAATSKRGGKAKAPTRKSSVQPEELQIGRPMGLGALVDWIAFRGGRVFARTYDKLMANATDALIKALREDESITRRSEVVGVPATYMERPREPIPLHLLGQTCSDVEKAAAEHQFVLILLDDKDGEYGGTLETLSDRQVWTRLQLDPRFVLDRWVPGTRKLDPQKQGPTALKSKAFSVADLRILVEEIANAWSDPEHPLSQEHMWQAVKSEMPKASRPAVREVYRPRLSLKKAGKVSASLDTLKKF